ncbi:MAG: Transketolase, partial [Parcubacteria group bacterium GW2011_GWA2_38_13]
TLEKAAKETNAIITVEDHFAEGGLGEAVTSFLSGVGAGLVPAQSGRPQGVPLQIVSLCVRKMPMSGTPQELLNYEEISKDGIIEKVKEVLN